jgi:putative DNA primase/helicase
MPQHTSTPPTGKAKISVVPDVRSQPDEVFTLAEVIEYIRSPGSKLEAQTEEIHRVYNETLARTGSVEDAGKAIDPLKKELCAYMGCGVFSARGDKYLKEYSRRIIADLDDLTPEVLKSTQAKLRNDPHVSSCHASPSGTGLKPAFHVAGDASKHARNFLAVKEHVKKTYGLDVDVKCKNVERLCFMAHDPVAWWRDDTTPLEPLDEEENQKPKAKPAPKAESRPYSNGKLHAPVSAATLKSLLKAIPSNDRDVWLKVLGALKLWGEENGKEDLAYELADEWARTSLKYDEDDQERTWESLRRDGDSGNVATIGSLFHLARKHGWKSALETTIEELAALDQVEYDRTRKQTAEELGIRASTLDTLVEKERNKKAGAETGLFAIPEPWPEPVDGEALVDDIMRTLKRFSVLPPVGYVAVGLCVLEYYAFKLFQYCPILSIRSPEKRCGKSTLLRLLAQLVPRPLSAANVTDAVLYRAISRWEPTLELDEWDSQRPEMQEAIRNILNSGFEQGGCTWRCVGDDHEPTPFPTFCPKVVAGIGELPETAASRAVTVTMHRRLPGEKIERLRGFDGTELRRKCVRWVQDNQERLLSAKPVMPDELDDREQDVWEALFAIADLCGEWGWLARVAALELCKKEQGESLAVELLRDIRQAFTLMGEEEDRLKTEELLSRLNGKADSPWPTFCDGKPLHPHRLSKMLARFGIAPRSIRIGRIVAKGYSFAQFEDSWSRYLANNHEDESA